MRSLFLEPRVYIIGLCEASSWVRRENARGQGQLCSLLWWALGVRVPEPRSGTGSREGASVVVRPTSWGSFGPSL